MDADSSNAHRGTASLLVDRLPQSLSRDCRVQSDSRARSKPCGPVRHPHSDSEWIGSHPALPNRLTENAGFPQGNNRRLSTTCWRTFGLPAVTSPAPGRCIPPQCQLGNLHSRAFHPLDHQLRFTTGSHPPSQHTRQALGADATGLASRRNRHRRLRD